MAVTSSSRAAQTLGHYERQAFHQPRTAIGAAGHWIKTAGILAPLVIHESIKDPEQKWRAIRISAVITAALAEVLWASRIRNERRHRQTEFHR